MDFPILFAGGLSAIWCLVHIFMGGPQVARPLLAATDLEKSAKYVAYYCWHLVSISLGMMSLLFLWPALCGLRFGVEATTLLFSVPSWPHSLQCGVSDLGSSQNQTCVSLSFLRAGYLSP